MWVGFFVLSPNKNIHYFLPAALLPMAVALRVATARAGTVPARLATGLLAVSAMAAIAASRPKAVPSYVADREFGRRTVFLAGTEREAVDFSRVLFQVAGPLWKWTPDRPWTIGHHTWVMYADRDFEPGSELDFYVGQGPPPAAGLSEVTRIGGPDGRPVIWWARGGRATLREWWERTYALRTELSRFNFEMPPAVEKE
jgi:hypothetical protein